ncbi:B3 domain-containing protein Os01g0723500-like [Telopea speciosissima]|uniref:B3 domain-containing protein Os01g0723500-like n=1 Tax=Telopea speciosissima TaxID=54955 RepID=UPI001CC67FEB|nr:B3 domain-containing protein Os01g0723500-like [Telopea speciosissima]
MVIARMTQRKPCFFKPILPGSFQEIAIPNAFLKHLTDENGEEGEAILKSHSHRGKSWHVKVKGFHFQEGWVGFAQDHDLVVGDFMVFRHEGGLVFETMVFDRNGCERKYPIFYVKKEDETLEKDERRGNETTVVEEINSMFIYLVVCLQSRSFSSILMSYLRKLCIGHGEGQKAAKIYATSSKIRHTSFVVPVRRFNLNYSIMKIPKVFVRSIGLSGKSCKAVLRDPKGRTWPVNLNFLKADGRMSIGSGWHKFAVSNCLKEEDVCIFKLICSTQMCVHGLIGPLFFGDDFV